MRVGYRVFPGIGGGLGLLSEYSVCPVGAPRVLGIEFVGRSKKKKIGHLILLLFLLIICGLTKF
ncbi:hypothetical protein Hanom_Chr16g01472241 [Helianthus anomalus]